MRVLKKGEGRAGQPAFRRFVRTGVVAARTLIKRNEAKGITSPGIEGANRSGVKASLTTAFAGANNDLTFRAKKNGVPGNSIRVAFVVAGANTPASIVVAGNDITVNVATSGASAANSRADTIRDAINGNPAANILVSAELATGNDGTGIVGAMGLTSLAGGVDGPDTVIRGAGQFDEAASSARVLRQKPALPGGQAAGGNRKRVSKAGSGPINTR